MNDYTWPAPTADTLRAALLATRKADEAERFARLIHEPHCNTFCLPARGWHYLTDGVGLPHLHRTDMKDKCGACITPSAEGAS